MNEPLLRVEDLAVAFRITGNSLLPGKSRSLKAVDGISFELSAGETLGVVGETGCGKSTLGKAVLQLVAATGGRVLWQGEDLCGLNAKQMKAYRDDLQIIFQDPLSSLNPRMTVGEIIGEPLRQHAKHLSAREREAKVNEMMERVGLRPEMSRRYPNEFSGGQCQRVSIARAMIVEPKVIVCDEPVSALDVSIQAQICNLLKKLQRDTGVALIFISHDLSIVRYMCDRVLVMYLGRMMELGRRDRFFSAPRHPYSRALLGAVPRPDPALKVGEYLSALAGEPPSPLDPPSGCVFRTRCPLAIPLCIRQVPPVEKVADGHTVACHRWREAEADSRLTGGRRAR